MSLHERIAAALGGDARGWTLEAVQSFSLSMLRELVRSKHPKLEAEIARALRSGSHIYGEPHAAR